MTSSLVQHIRHRRAVREHETTLRSNDALYDASRDLRRRAQALINSGDPEGARPFVEEAELFESAATPLLAS